MGLQIPGTRERTFKDPGKGGRLVYKTRLGAVDHKFSSKGPNFL